MLRFDTLCAFSILALGVVAPAAAQPGAGGYPPGRTAQPADGAPSAQTPAANRLGPPQEGEKFRIVSPAEAVQQGVARVPQMPFPPLEADQQQYLEQVLNVWEQRTASIERYQCSLTRWQYDPTQDAAAPVVIDSGILKYEAPDKGLFRIDQRQSISKKGPQPEYRTSDKQGEYWICDGQYVHILDRDDKKSTKIQLPPQMRGQQIYLSPLPFLFGVKSDEIQQRYWIRPVKPPQGSSDVWLEAFPKRTDDAGNYSRVQVVLDANDVLPKALIVFLPNWQPQQPHREVYEFKQRQTNWNFLSALKQKLFMEEFIETKLPSDWQIIVEPYVEPQEGPAPAANNLPPQRVAQPAAGQAVSR